MPVFATTSNRLGLATLLGTLLLNASASAQSMTWYVSGAALCPGDGSTSAPFCKIQSAIDAAFDGDVVLVSPGTYAEAIDFKGRDIRVASTAGAALTVINAAGKGLSAVRFITGEGPGAVLQGFRVSGGIGTIDPAIGFRTGGGIVARMSSPTISHCQISGNSAAYGGGAHVKGGTLAMNNCLVSGNAAQLGGGVLVQVDATLEAVNCTVAGNTGLISGGGVYHIGIASIANSILYGNTGLALVSSAVPPDVAFSDVQKVVAGVGNMNLNPLFATGFRLSAGSPCLDAGHNWEAVTDATDVDGDGDTAELSPVDLDGAARFVDSASSVSAGCGGGAIVDMGAFELADGPSVDMVLGDIDGDGMVGDTDESAMLASYGACMDACCLGDLDLDGMVGDLDLAILMDNWNQPPPPPPPPPDDGDDDGSCHSDNGKHLGHLKHDHSDNGKHKGHYKCKD